MQDWIAAHIDDGLTAFRGARLSGTLVVHQDLLNEIVAEWFAAKSPDAAPAPAPAAPDRQLTGLATKVTRIAVRAEAGAVSVDFEIAV